MTSDATTSCNNYDITGNTNVAALADTGDNADDVSLTVRRSHKSNTLPINVDIQLRGRRFIRSQRRAAATQLEQVQCAVIGHSGRSESLLNDFAVNVKRATQQVTEQTQLTHMCTMAPYGDTITNTQPSEQASMTNHKSESKQASMQTSRRASEQASKQLY
jgi:hypothetical protein